MDYALTNTVYGGAVMTWDKAPDIRTNIWISLNMKKGSLFVDPDFGLDLSDIKKITDANLLLAKQRIEDALAWMITVGKATSIAVTVERDTQDFNRMDIKVEARQPDGLLIVFQQYRPVGLGVAYDYKYEGGKVINLGTLS